MDTGSEAGPERPHDQMRALVSRRQRTTRACAWCGAAFETYANGTPGRFCSRAHRQRAYYRANRDHLREQARRRWAAGREHERRTRPVETTCLRCGKPVLQGSLGRIRRYCSQSCRQLAWVARRRHQSQETPASATM